MKIKNKTKKKASKRNFCNKRIALWALQLLILRNSILLDCLFLQGEYINSLNGSAIQISLPLY